MPTPQETHETGENESITLPTTADELDSGPRMILPMHTPDSPAQLGVRSNVGVALQSTEERVSGISLRPDQIPDTLPDDDQGVVLTTDSGVMAGTVADTGISLEKGSALDQAAQLAEQGSEDIDLNAEVTTPLEAADQLNTAFIFGDDDDPEPTPWVGPEDGNS